MKNMNKKIIIIGLLFGMFGCDEYLDIVPDQTQQIDLLFERKEVAYTALATCYAYLPKNDGVYTSTQTSDTGQTPSEDNVTIQIDPGKAYVRGYEIETVVPTYLDLPKPRTTDNFDSAITNIEVGNLTRVTKVFGTPDLAPFISGEVAEPHRTVELHGLKTSTRGATANQQVGVARARVFEHISGNTTNDTLSNNADSDAVFNIGLFEVG